LSDELKLPDRGAGPVVKTRRFQTGEEATGHGKRKANAIACGFRTSVYAVFVRKESRCHGRA
jgi:hypothetical protein